MSAKKSTINFEQAISDLEDLVDDLEAGDLSLEESLATFEKGIKLTRECQQQLNQAAQKVNQLIGEGEDAELVEFDPSDEKTGS